MRFDELPLTFPSPHRGEGKVRGIIKLSSFESFLRKQESRMGSNYWVPVYTGMTK
jgi:hypothetical protein